MYTHAQPYVVPFLVFGFQCTPNHAVLWWLFHCLPVVGWGWGRHAHACTDKSDAFASAQSSSSSADNQMPEDFASPFNMFDNDKDVDVFDLMSTPTESFIIASVNTDLFSM